MVSPPCWIKKLMNKHLVWHIPTHENHVYLTFDDGPIPNITPWILDTLQVYQAKATFFCVGENIIRHPDIFQRIKAEGHSIGNHTMQHNTGSKTSNDVYIKSVMACQQHTKTNLFRPPHGLIKPSQIQPLKQFFRIIMWSNLTYDFDKNTSPDKCYQNAIKNLRPGSIVVFHDNIKAEKNMRYALPLFLEFLQKNNLKAVGI